MNIHFQEIEPVYGIGHSFNVYVDGQLFDEVHCHVEDGSASTLWNFCKMLDPYSLTAEWLGETPYFATL